MIVARNFFDKKFIYPSSFNYKVKFFHKDGTKQRIKARDIEKLTFIDLKGDKRVFVENADFKNHIIEIVYLNKIQWYKHYYNANYSENTVNELFDLNGKRYSLGLFNSARKQIKKMTNYDPDVVKFLDDNKINDQNILKVIKLYETKL